MGMMANGQNEWVIGVPTWIIQDGNYPDFRTGDRTEFALEFYGTDLVATERREREMTHLRGSRYRVCAPVAYVRNQLWMIDVGVLAYREGGMPRRLRAEDWIAGEIVLSVDHFAYFEEIGPGAGVPPAIYTWRIRGIHELTAPTPRGGWGIDYAKLDWTPREVPETDAWARLPGLELDYDLICETLDLPPRNTLSRPR
jgi:hypothetical protein